MWCPRRRESRAPQLQVDVVDPVVVPAVEVQRIENDRVDRRGACVGLRLGERQRMEACADLVVGSMRSTRYDTPMPRTATPATIQPATPPAAAAFVATAVSAARTAAVVSDTSPRSCSKQVA